MKEILNIKSISNVITNSSSEVFIMNQGDADYYDKLENTNGCICVENIDWDWVKERGYYEYKMVADVCDLDLSELESLVFGKNTGKKRYYGDDWWGYPDKDDWETFIELHREVIEEKLIGKCWVDIEDHFEDAYNVSHSARTDCEWTDYRH